MGWIRPLNDKASFLENSDLNSGMGMGERFVLVVLLMIHIWACFRLLPPHEIFRREPLISADYPSHIHHAHIYREAFFQGGVPWGYDPWNGAGLVMGPHHDSGAKPIEIASLIFPFLEVSTVVRVLIFLSALTFPVWVLVTVRILGIPAKAVIWILAGLLAPAWFYRNFAGFFRWGLISFATASYLSPLILVLFMKFIDRPDWKRYWKAFTALSVQFLLHPLGPVVISPPLLIFTLVARPLSPRWRVAALIAPLGVIVVNGFWFFPLCLAIGMPAPPAPIGVVNGMVPDLTYESFGQMLGALTPYRLAASGAGLTLVAMGFYLLHRFIGKRTVWAFAMATATALLLKFTGSFIPGIVELQPSRFLLPLVSLLSIPVGTSLYVIFCRLGKKKSFSMVLVLMAGCYAVLIIGQPEKEKETYRNYVGEVLRNKTYFMGLPQSVPLPSTLERLTPFVMERTRPGDRLMVQTAIQAEPKVFPMVWRREVMGNAYPNTFDSVQFLKETVFGKELKNWKPEELAGALRRWGVNWVFVWTGEAKVLLEKAAGMAGEPVGGYQGFHIRGEGGMFLAGKGRITAGINRIELRALESSENVVVIRYRYHPAWESDSGIAVERYPVPEDPAGFIALRDPPVDVVLRFDPWAMLTRPWPAKESGIVLSGDR